MSSVLVRVVITASFALTTPAWALAQQLPVNFAIETGLRDTFRQLLQKSKTFRTQCLRLADARYLVVRIKVANSHSNAGQSRAITVLKRFESGLVIAEIDLIATDELHDLIAHELEHVLEFVEGFQYQRDAVQPTTKVWRGAGGHYETKRAVDVGHRVAAEMARDGSAAPKQHVLVSILGLGSSPILDITESIDRELPRIHANAISLTHTLPAHEHLVAIKSDGSVLWVIEGTTRAAVIDPESDADLYRPNAGIVLVHNHPGSASLSGADLEHLGKPGVASIVVVGHDGSIYTANAGRLYRTTELIGSLYPLARDAVTQRLRIERPSARVSTQIIDAQFEHLVALSLHKAEVIRYRAMFPKLRQATDAGWLRLAGVVTTSVAGKLKAAMKTSSRNELSRVRTGNGRIRLAIERGIERSTTFQSLVVAIQSSNLIVQVEDGRCGALQSAGCILVATATPTSRYLRIKVNAKQAMPQLIPLLAHELQHAVEISGAAEVVDATTLSALYQRVGERRDSAGHAYETARALRVAEKVAAELK